MTPGAQVKAFLAEMIDPQIRRRVVLAWTIVIIIIIIVVLVVSVSRAISISATAFSWGLGLDARSLRDQDAARRQKP